MDVRDGETSTPQILIPTESHDDLRRELNATRTHEQALTPLLTGSQIGSSTIGRSISR